MQKIKNRFHRILNRIWVIAGGASVRTKIFGIVLGSTILLSLAFTIQIRSALLSLLEEESREHGISIARDVAARATDLILVNDLYSLHELLEETQINHHDLRYAFILDENLNVIAHTFGEGFPENLIASNSINPSAYQHTAVIQSNDGVVWDVAVPILEGTIGTARIGISDVSIQQTFSQLISQFGVTVLVVIIIGLLAASFLTWILTKPILKLVEAATTIAQGDFSPRVPRWANDEIGDLAEAFNHMASELARTEEIRVEREELRTKLLDGVITAQEEERRRISRELHDSISQSLTSLLIGLKNLDEYSHDFGIHNQIEKLRGETGDTLDEVHTLAVRLRPMILDDLGLEVALRRLTSEWQVRQKINVDIFVHIENERLPTNVEIVLYRIVQEALTNIAKHSQASSVSVLLEHKNGNIVAIIEDDGIGFDLEDTPNMGHLGLLGMQERADLVGGKLIIESRKRKGTSVFAEIPVEKMLEPASG